ncbi:hypothetical protein POM88_046209 [Heracleum sosnowskyi]|uniref:TF-B3 domain-containing protein n=1 Tax=Heracleum sosnowskyi TaxID=360622 RepID=A0AAD8H8U7_9APIA|nr:hypothetical protein POM88_046209 [Heracleum sosnowskyi]
MTWIEIGFRCLKWTVKLKWKNGKVTFYKGWFDFAAAGKLRRGDICVFQNTDNPQQFEVAVFHRRNVNKFNSSGIQQGKSLMKWLKFMSADSIKNGKLEMPRVFSDQFGDALDDSVHLVLGDGNEYCVQNCAFNNLLCGMQNMFKKYNVAEDYILLFDYLGRSHCYVSIYNNNGFDILDGLTDRIMLRHVLNWTECPVVVLSDDSSECDAELGNINSMVVGGTVVMDESFSSEPDKDHDVLHEAAAQSVTTFSVVLKSTHIDQKDHGVYIPYHLLKIYKGWRNAASITLVCGDFTFNVEVHRKKDICRFGLGWDTFTGQMGLVEGQYLEFQYRGNSTFEVYV